MMASFCSSSETAASFNFKAPQPLFFATLRLGGMPANRRINMDGDEDNVEIMTVDVPEDDIEGGLPVGDPEELQVRPQPAAPQRTAPAAPRQPRGADVLRDQLNRSTALVESLQGANTRAQSELVNQRRENAELKRTQVEDRRTTLGGTLKSIDVALDEAEKALAAAFESGVGADVAKAQRRMSELTAQRHTYQSQFDLLPSQEQLKEQTEAATLPRTEEEKIEAYIGRFTSRSQEWLRSHPDYITDRAKNQRLLNAHKMAVEAQIEPDTDEYFDYLNKRLVTPQSEPRREAAPINGGQEPQPMKRAQTPVRTSAPVRGGGSGISVQGTRSVRLTQGEITQATDGTHIWNAPDPTGRNRWRVGDPIGVNEMARRKAAIQSGKAGNLRYMTGEDA
jgi:hypothetical protein